MLTLRRLHLYLGCLFAPVLIFFAVTGSWQLFRANDDLKDGSYHAPVALKTLSAIHKDSHLPGKHASAYTPLKTFSLLAAAGLVFSTVLGIVMAFRSSRSAVTPGLLLGAGVLIPCLILYLYR